MKVTKKAKNTLLCNRRENVIPAMKHTKKAKKTLLYNRVENVKPAKKPTKKTKNALLYGGKENHRNTRLENEEMATIIVTDKDDITLTMELAEKTKESPLCVRRRENLETVSGSEFTDQKSELDNIHESTQV